MSYWMWYPADYEIYHSKIQNLSRTERDFSRAAYWPIAECNQSVVFSKKFLLEKEETITIKTVGQGFAHINGTKHGINEDLLCPKGEVEIKINVFHYTSGLPCAYVQGKTIKSDDTWFVDNYMKDPQPVNINEMYTEIDDNPMEFPYKYKMYTPVKIYEQADGILYDFEAELYAHLHITKRQNLNKNLFICYGESLEEALDKNNCYHYDESKEDENYFKSILRAFRYIYIENINKNDITISAEHQYVKFDFVSKFTSDDMLLNKIWDISRETFALNSRVFFIDGIKRDGWIWSGDAYQSYFINQYLFFDMEINKRTILSLFGKLPVCGHINTIVDYSLLWVISVLYQYNISGDVDFVRSVYSKMVALVEFTMKTQDENGFIVGRDVDWTFIDWADIDKTGAVCAEQILLYEALLTIEKCSEILGLTCAKYAEKANELKEKIFEFYWHKDKGAFIDSYVSGKNNVTRHANIFAILFDFVDEDKKDSIVNNVLLNNAIPQITTPYFKFYELDALGKCGLHNIIWDEMVSYWGGMIKNNCTTFWEEYDPEKSGVEHFAMYGNKFEKSLCHAWGASPIYLIGRYFIGLQATSTNYKTYLVSPNIEIMPNFSCTLPIGKGEIFIERQNETLKIKASKAGGKLILKEKTIEIPKEKTIEINLN